MGNTPPSAEESSLIADDWRRGGRAEFTAKAGAWGRCPVGCLALHETEAAVAVAGVDGDLRCAGVYSLSCELQSKLSGHGDTIKWSAAGALKNGDGVDGSIIFTVALSGDTLVTGGADSTLRLWDWRSGAPKARIDAAHGGLEIMCVAVEGDTLVSSAGFDVKRWSVHNRRCVSTVSHAGYVRTVSIASSSILSAGEDKHCHVWPVDATDASVPARTLVHAHAVWAARADGDLLATACRGEAAATWDAQVCRPLGEMAILCLSVPVPPHARMFACDSSVCYTVHVAGAAMAVEHR